MNELIKIKDQDGRPVVSAREVYEFLGLNTAAWARWYKKNIINNDFAIEGQDYTGFNIMLNGNEVQDFTITLDFAKRLSMMARTEKGEQVRNYFIECEKRAAAPKLLSAKELAQLVIKAEEEKELLQATIAKQAPAVKYVNQVLQAENTHTVTTIAKEVGMSAEALNKLLQEKKIQYKHAGHWVLYAPYQDKGYTKTKTTTYTNSENKAMTAIQTVWTERGRVFIHHLLEQRKQA